MAPKAPEEPFWTSGLGTYQGGFCGKAPSKCNQMFTADHLDPPRVHVMICVDARDKSVKTPHHASTMRSTTRQECCVHRPPPLSSARLGPAPVPLSPPSPSMVNVITASIHRSTATTHFFALPWGTFQRIPIPEAVFFCCQRRAEEGVGKGLHRGGVFVALQFCVGNFAFQIDREISRAKFRDLREFLIYYQYTQYILWTLAGGDTHTVIVTGVLHVPSVSA